MLRATSEEASERSSLLNIKLLEIPMSLQTLISRLDNLENHNLYEGLDLVNVSSVRLWESAGYAIREAALTTDQIQQLFKQIEQGATTAGGNRTAIGQGKDAAAAVNKAWEDLKTKVQNSGPIKNVDSAYDSVVSKIEAGLGGPDNAVNQVIQKYRAFAKAHPIAQGLIYSALIAAAGLSGAGLGGAAVLGLLKMTDKLLQGEKFSSAAYSGAKTGAMAYAAGQIGKAIQGDQAPTGATDAAAGTPIKGARGLASEAERIFREKVANGEVTDYNSYQQGMQDSLQQALKNAGGQIPFQSQQTAGDLLRSKLDHVVSQTNGGQFTGSGPEKAAELIKQLGGRVDADKIAQQTAAAAQSAGGGLREAQIQQLFAYIEDTIITEGILDTIKGAAGKAASWVQTKGHNLTNKVTADKLNSAWTKAGSPTDSDQVATILTSAGVHSQLIEKIYQEMGIEIPTWIAATSSASSTTSVNTKDLLAQILKLEKAQQQEILALLKA
jgi:hypothetical protein